MNPNPESQIPNPAPCDLPCHSRDLQWWHAAHKTAQPHDDDWVTFPGGELEGKRPTVLCPACREQLKRVAAGAHAQGNARPREHAARTFCFQCFRAEIDRDKALKAAGA